MDKHQPGPFKRRRGQKNINSSMSQRLTPVALILLILTQIPTAIKTTFEISCILKDESTINIDFNWCKDLKS